ncbi:hypothetical protein ACFPZ0_24920 [Streptomonospora nanhaiensis]|uniref:Uncharacterized protein n=1 Tax=Streptomonospora nanhaiensis TaxID=1323731 RepID=A0A853BPK6_9ACTN|nr:hypothetical protein [Streptomonospora nanhaiensis]MBX9391371.1 hypothetical protein [Streptomonospora nanhaiensis]NYI96451.1 hypothetical protein [Streptomonospora nanhaiensis]
MAAAYSAVVAATVLLGPAVVAVAARIGRHHPGLAAWGGTLTLLGLFARAFHAGAGHLAFQLVRSSGPAVPPRATAPTTSSAR